MKSLVLACVLLLMLTAPLTAAAPVPQDFAYGCQLPAAEDGGVFSLRLPLAVYERITQPSLGDLRVFNGAGEVVPHTLRRPEPERNRNETRKPLPFFPLTGAQADQPTDLAMRVSRSADGTVLSVDMGRQSSEKTSWSFLIDTSKADATPASLELEWTGNAHSVLALSLSQSSDLTHWQPLVSRVVLADLQYQGQAIAQRRINLHGKTMPYLRIDCLDCTGSPQLQSIMAVFQAAPPVETSQWLDIKPHKTSRNQTELIYEYQLAAQITVSGMQLVLPVANSLVQASIESRQNDSDPWRIWHSGPFYALDLEGHQVANLPVTGASTGDRYWRVRIADNGAGLDSDSRTPVLQLGWRPDQLLFVGRGKGPYTLAFGSTSQNMAQGASGELILGALREARSESLIRRIEPGPVFALGGEKAIKPRVAKATWQKIALWIVLIAGVALLALMTRALVREMRKKAVD